MPFEEGKHRRGYGGQFGTDAGAAKQPASPKIVAARAALGHLTSAPPPIAPLPERIVQPTLTHGDKRAKLVGAIVGPKVLDIIIDNVAHRAKVSDAEHEATVAGHEQRTAAQDKTTAEVEEHAKLVVDEAKKLPPGAVVKTVQTMQVGDVTTVGAFIERRKRKTVVKAVRHQPGGSGKGGQFAPGAGARGGAGSGAVAPKPKGRSLKRKLLFVGLAAAAIGGLAVGGKREHAKRQAKKKRQAVLATLRAERRAPRQSHTTGASYRTARNRMNNSVGLFKDVRHYPAGSPKGGQFMPTSGGGYDGPNTSLPWGSGGQGGGHASGGSMYRPSGHSGHGGGGGGGYSPAPVTHAYAHAPTHSGGGGAAAPPSNRGKIHRALAAIGRNNVVRVAAVAGVGLGVAHLARVPGSKFTVGAEANREGGWKPSKPGVGLSLNMFHQPGRSRLSAHMHEDPHAPGRGTLASHPLLGRLQYNANQHSKITALHFQPGHIGVIAGAVGATALANPGRLFGIVSRALGRGHGTTARVVSAGGNSDRRLEREDFRSHQDRARAALGHLMIHGKLPEAGDSAGGGRAELSAPAITHGNQASHVRARQQTAVERARAVFENNGKPSASRPLHVASANDQTSAHAIRARQQSAVERARAALEAKGSATGNGKPIKVVAHDAKGSKLNEEAHAAEAEAYVRHMETVRNQRRQVNDIEAETERLAGTKEVRAYTRQIQEAAKGEGKQASLEAHGDLVRWDAVHAKLPPPKKAGKDVFGRKVYTRGQGGEYDWYDQLGASEQRRLKTNGHLRADSNTTIDNLSHNISMAHGGTLSHDEAMGHWLDRTSTIDGGNALSHGKIPGYVPIHRISTTLDEHTYDGINPEHIFGPQAVHHVARVMAISQAEKFNAKHGFNKARTAARILKHPGHADQSVHGRRKRSQRGRSVIREAPGGRTGSVMQGRDEHGRFATHQGGNQPAHSAFNRKRAALALGVILAGGLAAGAAGSHRRTMKPLGSVTHVDFTTRRRVAA